MFDNIGGKIKGLSKIVCYVGIIASIISGMILILIGGSGDGQQILLIGIGFLVMILGSLLSWLGSFFTYGFGELIAKTAKIEAMLNTEESHRTTHEGQKKCPYCEALNDMEADFCVVCGRHIRGHQ